MAERNFDQIFPLGEKNDAYAQYFIGQSYLAPLTSGSVPVSNVSFEPVTDEVYAELPKNGEKA